jgi:hypothetical protein
MSFKSYEISALPDGSLRLHDPEPLVFSGKNGLIARFVLTAGERAQERWMLSPGELHAVAIPDLPSASRLIVFEPAAHDRAELLELDVIHGTSGERTEMMFAFHALDVEARLPSLVVRRRSDNTTYIEELSLEGGAFAPAGTWRWRRPHLALGGVVCGGPGRP